MPLPQSELSLCERIFFFSQNTWQEVAFCLCPCFPVFQGTRVIFMQAKLPGLHNSCSKPPSFVLSCPHLLSYSTSFRLLLWRNRSQKRAVATRAADRPYLSGRLDSLDHGEADQSPGGQQGQGHLPVETSALRDAVGDVQGLAVPVVGGGRALLALRHHICGHNGRSFSSPPLTLL